MPDQSPIIVEVEGVGEVEFPAGTSNAEIKSKLLNIRQKVKKDTGTTDNAESWASTAAGFGLALGRGALKGAGQSVVGATRLLQMVPGVTAGVDAMYGAPGLSAHAMDAADKFLATDGSWGEGMGKAGEQVLEAVATGSPVRQAGEFAVTHAAPILSGVVGKGLAKALPKIATEAAAGGLQTYIQGGDPTAGAVLAGAAPAIAQGGRVARNALFAGKANPVVQGAIDYAGRAGVDIPVSASTATGKPFVAKVEKALAAVPGSAGVVDRFKAKQAEALTRVAGDLADAAHPTSVTPTTAAQGVRQTVEQTIAAENAEQAVRYGKLRQIEADPRNLKRVQVGTRTLPDGTVETVMDDVPMPVDMRPVKAALKPVLDKIEKTWNVTKKDASDGLVALRNLVHGADAEAASTADENLGLIKKIVREATSPDLMTRGQGLAAQAVGELEAAVQKAVRQAGPDAVDALRMGRAATIRKYAAADALDLFKENPTGFFDALTARRENGLPLLHEVQKHAPAELPKIGRAYIEEMFTKATSEGEFDHAQALLAKWESLGPETKKLIFPNPMHRKDLDHFFLIAKKIAENPNPSGTAGVNAILNPVAWAAYFPAKAIASVLYSPNAIRQLTKGITTGNTSAVTEALGRVAANQTAHAASGGRP
jgi:hypothetical protein